MPELSFHLIEGEEIVKDIKPLEKLKLYFFIPFVLTIIVEITIAAIVAMILVEGSITIQLPFVLYVTLAIIFVTGLIGLIYSFLRYKWQHYWITNKRIIYQMGLIGYEVSSIPLERISDIILSRNVWERILGIGSLHIQSLAGQITYGKYGVEAQLKAIPQLEETEKLIFKLIERKRKREKLRF